MEFDAARARREGRLLTKYQRDRDWVRGELTVSEQRDNELHRVVRVARLRGARPSTCCRSCTTSSSSSCARAGGR